jgi:hypothetical protein
VGSTVPAASKTPSHEVLSDAKPTWASLFSEFPCAFHFSSLLSLSPRLILDGNDVTGLRCSSYLTAHAFEVGLLDLAPISAYLCTRKVAFCASMLFRTLPAIYYERSNNSLHSDKPGDSTVPLCHRRLTSTYRQAAHLRAENAKAHSVLTP